MLPEHFLSCDWGTTRFRLRLAEIETARVLAETASDSGVAKLASERDRAALPAAYRQTLHAGIAALQSQVDRTLANLPVVISGMASSSLGWCELAYAKLPFALSGANANWRELEPHSAEGKHAGVYLVSGVCSDDDVVRGEETELLGAWQLAQAADFGDRGLVVMPGTHSKHLEVRRQNLVGIQTYMTGELFEVVGRHSVLRHSLPARNEPNTANTSVAANRSAVDFAELRRPFIAGAIEGSHQPLSHALFHVRTKSLLSGMTPPESEAYLSGLLIGAELSALMACEWNEMPVVLCAGGEFSARYELAVEILELMQPLLIVPAEDVARLATRGQAVLLKQILSK
jgi:2-dehydro-3-deoxygalactonokinase